MNDLNDEIQIKMQAFQDRLDMDAVNRQRQELVVELAERVFGSSYIAAKYPDLFSYVHKLPKCVGKNYNNR